MKRRTFAALLPALSCAWGQDVFDKIVHSHGDRFMGDVAVSGNLNGRAVNDIAKALEAALFKK